MSLLLLFNDGAPTQSGAAALQAESSMGGGTAVVTKEATVAATASSSLAATATRTAEGAVAMTATSTATVSGVREAPASVAATASATLVIQASVEAVGFANLSSVSELSAFGVRGPTGAVGMVSTTTLTTEATAGGATVIETASLRTLFQDYVVSVASSGNYVAPIAQDITDFKSIWANLKANAGGPAHTLAGTYNYEVVDFTDTETGRKFWVLREKTTRTKWWGIYVLSREATASRMIVGSPHTVSDGLNIQHQAVDTFIKANGTALFGTGSSRTASATVDAGGDNISDVAAASNPPSSIFQAITEAHATASSFMVEEHAYGTTIVPPYGSAHRNGTNTAVVDTAATTGSVVKPSRTKEGDFLVGHVVVRDVTATVTGPTGWTMRSEGTDGSAPGIKAQVWTKTATASEPANYAWTWTTTSKAVLNVTAFADCGGIDVISVASEPSGTTVTAHSTAPVTTTVPDTVLLALMCVTNATSWSTTGATGTTDRVVSPQTTATNSISSAVYDNSDFTRAVGTYTATASNPTASSTGVFFLLALKPAGVVVPTDFVLSEGTANATHPAHVNNIATDLRALGYAVVVNNGFWPFTASNNEQGITVRALGAQFLNVEQRTGLVTDATSRAAIASVIAGYILKSGAAVLASDTSLTSAGTLALGGTSTMSASSALSSVGDVTGAVVTHQGIASLSADSSLSSAGVRTAPAAAALTSSTTLSAAGIRTAPGVAALSATGTLASDGVVTTNVVTGAAALTSSTTLTAAGVRTAPGAVALVSDTSLATTGIRTVLGVGPLVADSTLASAGVRTALGVVALTSSSSLTATGEIAGQSSAALVASSTLAPSGIRVAPGVVALTSSTTLSAAGITTAPGVVALTSTTTLTSSGIRTAPGVVALTSSTTLAATGVRTAPGAVSLASDSTLTAAGIRTAHGVVPLVSSSTLFADATVTTPLQAASAALVATGTLSASGVRTALGIAGLVATSTLGSDGVRSTSGVATLVSASSLAVAGVTTRPGAAALSGSSTLAATGVRTVLGAVPLAASSTLDTTATATTVAAGAAALVATGTLTSTATAIGASEALLVGSATLTTVAIRTARAGTVLFSTTTLTTTGFRVVGTPNIELFGQSVLGVDPFTRIEAAVAMASEAEMLYDAEREIFAQFLGLVAESTFTSSPGAATRFGTASMEATGSLSITSVAFTPGSVPLRASATLSVTGVATRRAVVALVAESAMPLLFGVNIYEGVANLVGTSILEGLPSGLNGKNVSSGRITLSATSTIFALKEARIVDSGSIAMFSDSTMDGVAPDTGEQYMRATSDLIIGPLTFYTRFVEYAVGSTPADWLKFGNGPGLSPTIGEDSDGERYMRITKPLTGIDGLIWTLVPPSADAEVYVEFQSNSAFTGAGRMKAGVRMGRGTDRTGYFAGHGQSVQTRITKYTPTQFLVDESTAPEFPAGTRIRARFRVDGFYLYVKVWKFGTHEPIAWDITKFDRQLIHGSKGIFTFGSSLNATDTKIYAFGAAVLKGNVAPKTHLTSPKWDSKVPIAVSYPFNQDDAPNTRYDLTDWDEGRDGGDRIHRGLDIYAPIGAPVYAMTDGIIHTFMPGFNGVVDNLNDGLGYGLQINTKKVRFTYGHFGPKRQGAQAEAFAPGIEPGVYVTKGQLLGWSGESGATASGPHLHIDWRDLSGDIDDDPYADYTITLGLANGPRYNPVRTILDAPIDAPSRSGVAPLVAQSSLTSNGTSVTLPGGVVGLYGQAILNGLANPPQARVETASLRTMFDDYAISASGSNLYATPSAADLTGMQEAWNLMLAGELDLAAQKASLYNYQVVDLTDTETGKKFYVLREAAVRTKYWGIYVWNRETEPRPMIVAVPHTVADGFTDAQGIDLFIRSRARAIFGTGSHRNASTVLDVDGDRITDVANVNAPPSSVFQAITETATLSTDYFVEPHGYGDGSVPPTGSAHRRGFATDIVDTAGNSGTVTKSSRMQVGDRLLVHVAVRNTSVTVIPPTGEWELVVETNDGTPGIKTQVWTKTLAVDDPSSFTWTWTGTSAKAILQMVAYSSCGLVDVAAGRAETSTAALFAHSTPSITTTVPDTVLVAFYGVTNSSSWATTGTTLLNTRIATRDTSAGSSLSTAMYDNADFPLPAGTYSASATNPTDSTTGGFIIVALRPAGVVTPTEVVVSPGTTALAAHTTKLTADLKAAGINAVEYDATWTLGATGNVQGIFVRSIGGKFIHVEQSPSVRENVTRRSLVNDIIARQMAVTVETAPTLQGTSSLSAEGRTQQIIEAPAALVGTSELIADAQRVKEGAVAMTASTTLTSAGVRSKIAVVAMVASAVLSWSAQRVIGGVAALRGSAVLSVLGTRGRVGIASLLATAVLTTVGKYTRIGSVNLIATARMTRTGVYVRDPVTGQIVRATVKVRLTYEHPWVVPTVKIRNPVTGEYYPIG